MRPVAVIQHTEVGAPGAIAPILHQLGCELRLFQLFQGDALPSQVEAFSGMVLLGGSMGVHDRLPWMEQEFELVREADRLGLALAGHCLGSQVVAFALGGSVGRLDRPEIGWVPMQADDHDLAREWWGEAAGRELTAFQWHQDSFTPPAGATPLASSRYCAHQAFVLHDRHLLVQSHLEITPELVHATLEKNRAQLMRQIERGNPAAQPAQDMLADLSSRTGDSNQLLARLYGRWVKGLRA